ncbi:Calcium/calmodulin-dependent protein kinase type IV [Tupaia chinensis]|uniref:Calcium/calmodulin-dependent protein kinase type IV n=1 Tax=Tupaia chinensis TaxID=246437 RepID=L8YGJ2_TUPCH|nr:Calcium/calmodulin-dependent protein kinase type IV [Tupaia chinensis]
MSDGKVLPWDQFCSGSCVVKSRGQLGFQLQGFSLLTAEGNEALKRQLPGVKSEGEEKGEQVDGVDEMAKKKSKKEKETDFGLSKIVEHQVLMKTVCGTPGYCAPEILRGCAYGPEVDMWSVGVITYILLCGFEPFYDERGDQFMFRRILNCEYYFISPWWDEVSLNAKDLVKKLIVLDPKKRLTTFQALQHPWVTGKAANFVHMDTAQKKLQEFNARRKLKAAVKAVVASSRLGSASSSHGSIPESHRASRDPSPTPEGKEDIRVTSEEEKIQGGEAPVAAKGAEAELMKVPASEEAKDAERKAEEATKVAPEVLEDGMKAADPQTQEGAAERLKTVEEAATPMEGQEPPAAGLAVPQQGVIQPED